MRSRLGALAALLAFTLASSAPPAAAAGKDGEDRLRRRVKRFYVLNYLNRYGEMWEMFGADLRERLGGDRQEYVKSSRGSGFELFASRIEGVERRGDLAAVDVVLQVQLAGSFEVGSRRHRMAWRFEEGDWYYAGSVDVTHSLDEEAVRSTELQPPSRARAPEVSAEQLLPPREQVGTGRAPAASSPPAAGEPGERWDLVAVPPPGALRPAEDERAANRPPPADETARDPLPGAAGDAAERVATVAPEAPARPQPVEEWLPPERASPSPPAPPSGAAGPRDDAALQAGTRLVQRAVEAMLPRRVRALEDLRRLHEPRLAPMMARALEHAPPATAEALLGELARYQAFGETEAVVRELDDPASRVRAAAARALRVLGDSRHASRLERAARQERDDAARAEAVRAAAAVSGPAAGPLLAELLREDRAGPLSLQAAARAAGACGCREVAEPLIALARGTHSDAVAASALLALGRAGHQAGLALLEDVAGRGLRLPAEAAGELDGVLEARRGLALAGEPGSGDALAALLLFRGLSAGSEDVVLVAGTGDRDALLSLLAHPEPALRRRAADLTGRVVEDETDAAAALQAVAAALLEERDRVTLDALLDARERLQVSLASS